MSVTDIPAELLTPEQCAERIATLEREITREWVRFAITELVAIWVPFGLFLFVYASGDSISDAALYVGIAVAVVAMVALVGFWLARRIMPRTRELDRLKTVSG